MTEAEWLTCTDPIQMLEYLKNRASDRKLRLFTCACARRMIHLVFGIDARLLMVLAEADVDGKADSHQVAEGVAMIRQYIVREFKRDNESWNPEVEAGEAIVNSLETCEQCAWRAAWHNVTNALPPPFEGGKESARLRKDDYVEKASILRDIFGNPFRPARIDRSILSPTVTALAQMIYDQDAFEAMPELADHLQKAGCTNEAILEHCRRCIDHVRGCWVIDVLLGKE